MSRKDIFTITEEVLKFLGDEKEHSINDISHNLKIQWKTAVKVLEFLKKVGLVKEKKGKETYRFERLFILSK